MVDEEERALEEEITSDAEKRAERIKRRAEREAERVIKEAESEAETALERALADASELVAHEKEVSGGRVRQEVARLKRQIRHRLVERVRTAAERRLQELGSDSEHRRSLERLAIAAIDRMRGEQFELVLRPGDRESEGAELVRQIEGAAREKLGRQVELQLAEDTVDAAGGLIVRGVGGHEQADQTYGARFERLWDQMRPHLIEMLPEVEKDSG